MSDWQNDNFLLQLRGKNPVIGGAGLIGCFGGKIEDGESSVAAVRREINEETSYASTEDDFVQLGAVDVISDHKLETVKVHAEVFGLKLDESIVIDATEGELVTLSRAEVPEYLDKMTTGTKASFEKFILRS